MTEFGRRGVDVVFLDQNIDTSTPHGKLIFTIFAALAEYEADLTRQRVLEGLEAARNRNGGALPTRGPSFTAEQRRNADELVRKTDFSAARIAEMVGVSGATLYRHVDITKIREETQQTVKPSGGTLPSEEALAALRAKLSREAS